MKTKITEIVRKYTTSDIYDPMIEEIVAIVQEEINSLKEMLRITNKYLNEARNKEQLAKGELKQLKDEKERG